VGIGLQAAISQAKNLFASLKKHFQSLTSKINILMQLISNAYLFGAKHMQYASVNSVVSLK